MRIDSHIPISLKQAYVARHEPEAQRILARVYWAFLVVVMMLSICASIAFGVWEFTRTSSAVEPSAMKPRTSFTRTELLDILKGFDNRAVLFQQRITAPVNVKDPSQ